MAESVDALVSNTSGAIHPGSIPGLGTKKILVEHIYGGFSFCQDLKFGHFWPPL